MKPFLRFLALYFLAATALFPIIVHSQEAFPPPEVPFEVNAAETQEAPRIDGNLSEAAWLIAPKVGDFIQMNPLQGAAPSGTTEVRVLYDADFLYVGAFCRDSVGKYGVRLQNFRRDFAIQQNDVFGFKIDTYRDKRSSFGFFVTPAGAQTDRMFANENDENVEWDALWYAKTSVSDSGWTAEIAIPWKTLRYPEGATTMGIIFLRGIRRKYEFSSFPPVPRAFTITRMAYAAVLKGIAPPPPSASIQVNPYLLADANRTVQAGKETALSLVPKVGGEVKWAITPNSVLDVTVNTDFAQADADRQVVNLSRFSVLFPERRQFFLENAGLFSTGFGTIQPFFSRSIGLDASGNPVPIDAGLRYVAQSSEESIGALAMRQRGSASSPVSWFGVARYSKNVGTLSRVGGLLTLRNDEGFTGADGTTYPGVLSGTATIDGIFRPVQRFAAQGMASLSFDPMRGRDIAAAANITANDTWYYFSLQGQYAGKNYAPSTGFMGLRDFMSLFPIIDFDLRPTWLPAFIRSYGPDAYADWYWSSDGRFLQSDMMLGFIDFEFQNGGDVEYRYEHHWQAMDGTFQPLGIRVADGFYNYSRHRFKFSWDMSAPVGGVVRYVTGGFFDGELNTLAAELRLAPLPNAEFTLTYELNQIRGLGKERHATTGEILRENNFDTHLFGVNARFAVSPQLQLIGFGQWSSAAQRTIWNVRLAWEYLPLSFVYVVFNSNDAPFTTAMNMVEQRTQQQGIVKITFVRQL